MKAAAVSVLLLFLAPYAARAATSDAIPTPRVRSIYETPLLADPKLLWDRWEDLLRIQRRDDATLLAAYIERSEMQIIVGETPRFAPTLAALLEMERAAPVDDLRPLRERILSTVQATLDESPDATLMPPKSFVEWHYEGHGVWSDGKQPDHAFLRIAVVNRSDRRISDVQIRANIMQGDTRAASLLCDESKERGIPPDSHESVVTLCNTWNAMSHSGGAPLNTQHLLELMKQVDTGTAVLALKPAQIAFPNEEILVTPDGAGEFLATRASTRAYPDIGFVTCADTNTCEAERQRQSREQRERLIFNPMTFGLVLLVLACLLAYFLPLAARALGLVAIVGGIVAALAIPGSGLAGFILIFVAGGCFVFGVVALIASLLFGRKGKRDPA